MDRILPWLALLVVALASGGGAAWGKAPVFKYSDVIAMSPGSPEIYRAFSVTSVAWGSRPEKEADVARFRTQMEELHRLGVRYSSSVGMVTEFASFMRQYPEWPEAVCLNVRGEKLRVPWLWDHSYQGNPAYWFCTNDPHYRKYLEDQVVLAARGGVDGIHIDDHLGAAATYWLDGCFCDHCIAGFRSYLREHVPAARRKELGATDLDSFNYRDFAAHWLAAHPGRHLTDVPLYDAYQVYEFRTAEALMADLHRRAEQAAGRALTFSANAGLPDTASLADYRTLTYFSAEVDQHASEGLPPSGVSPVVAYSLAAALDRPLAATASGQDWAFIKANQRPELVRAWIAEAYAFGQFLMAPHHQWCYTEKLGTHWYDGPAEEYGPIYRFIREHPALFDGQENAARVAVLHSTEATRRGDSTEEAIVAGLLSARLPFAMVAAGDAWAPAQLTRAQVAPYAEVIVPEKLQLDPAQQRVLDHLKKEGRLVVWTGPETLGKLPPAGVTVTGSEQLWLTFRASAERRHAVLHLLNRDYDPAGDRVVATGRLTVTVKADALGGRLQGATLYAPGAAPITLTISTRGGVASFEVPSVGVWGVVELVR